MCKITASGCINDASIPGELAAPRPPATLGPPRCSRHIRILKTTTQLPLYFCRDSSDLVVVRVVVGMMVMIMVVVIVVVIVVMMVLVVVVVLVKRYLYLRLCRSGGGISILCFAFVRVCGFCVGAHACLRVFVCLRACVRFCVCLRGWWFVFMCV